MVTLTYTKRDGTKKTIEGQTFGPLFDIAENDAALWAKDSLGSLYVYIAGYGLVAL